MDTWLEGVCMLVPFFLFSVASVLLEVAIAFFWSNYTKASHFLMGFIPIFEH